MSTPTKQFIHQSILIAAQSKFGKTSLAENSRYYEVICTEPNGSGWIEETATRVHFLKDWLDQSAENLDFIDPVQQCLLLIHKITSEGKGVFLDSFSALQQCYLDWLRQDIAADRKRAKPVYDRQMNDGRAQYASWTNAANSFLRNIARKPVIVTCLVADADISQRDEATGELHKWSVGSLKLSPSLSGEKKGSVTIASQFSTVLVGGLESDNKTRVWISPEGDNRPIENRQRLPVADPMGIMKAFARVNKGFVYNKPAEGEAPFIDRIWAYVTAQKQAQAAKALEAAKAQEKNVKAEEKAQEEKAVKPDDKKAQK